MFFLFHDIVSFPYIFSFQRNIFRYIFFILFFHFPFLSFFCETGHTIAIYDRIRQLESHYLMVVRVDGYCAATTRRGWKKSARFPWSFYTSCPGVDRCPAIRCRDPQLPFESVGQQLADTFSLTRSHQRIYGPPAVSFSCLDIDGETSLRGTMSETPGVLFKTEGQGFFFKLTVNDVHSRERIARI